MGTRFRKSVKICKGVKVNFSKSGASLSLGGRGHSVNMGGRGTRMTVGIPGTGLSYSTKIGGSKKRKSTGTRRKTTTRTSSRSTVQLPSSVGLSMDEKGQITILDSHNNPITDAAVLRKIRSTESYKRQREELERQRQQKINEIVANSNEENSQFINIGSLTPVVDDRKAFEEMFNTLSPEEYTEPKPTRDEVEDDLMEEAKEEVKAPFWKKSKMRKAYVEEHVNERLAEYVNEWEKEKAEAEEHFLAEYEARKDEMAKLLSGDEKVVCDIFDEWIASCELPVEININYELDMLSKTMLLDVDLPEIEDLPDTIMTKTNTGNLKEKKKTQGEKKSEYAKCVFGLAMFITANAFNISPDIQRVLISGYTQRRDKTGNLNDDYIYSIKFTRDIFEKKNVSGMDPQTLAMSVVNRCNMTSTALFKTITPYESFDEE